MHAIYRDLDATWQQRTASLNRRLAERGLPLAIAHVSSVWTVCYTASSRYSWMFQYYLREAGLALAWIGTGRLIFSLNFRDADVVAVADRFLLAAAAMRRDGWWEQGALATDKAIKRRILRERLAQLLPPQLRWGGVREADGGVGSTSTAAHDPSGPSGHLPIAESAMERK
jgi:glutamate-1-semialdehyde 2,1-aminomutase